MCELWPCILYDCIQSDENVCHIALHIHFHQLIRKYTAWVTPCRHVNSLTLWPLIKLAGLESDLLKMYSSYSGERLPSHVMWCNFISLSKHFFFPPNKLDESWHVVKARHKMNVSVSKHLLHFHQLLNHIDHASQACYWLILREIPTFQGKLHSAFRWTGEIIHVYLFIPTPPPSWWPYYYFFKLLKWSQPHKSHVRKFQTLILFWEMSPRLLYIYGFRGQTLLHSFHKEPSVDPSNFPGLHHRLWII